MTGLSQSAFLADVDAHDRDTARLALTLAGGVTLGYVAATLVDLALRPLPQTLQDLLFDTLANGLLWLTFVALAAIIAHHRLRAYISAAERIRWRLLVLGVGLALPALAPVAIADVLTASPSVSLATAWSSIAPNGVLVAIASALLLIPAAAAEELFFRGWLLRQTAAFTRRPLFLIFFTAVIFATIHPDFSAVGFLTRVTMGAGFAYMTLRLGGIEFSAGAHVANNLMIVLLIEPLTFGAARTSNSLFEVLIGEAAMAAGYVLITEIVARTPALSRWAGVQPQDISQTPRRTPSFS